MNTSLPFFEQLLLAAAGEPQPQRILFVFTQSELPTDATDAQRIEFQAGHGCALTPLACVDKAAAELGSFEALAAESRAACPPWKAVFIAALGGRSGQQPSPDVVEAALKTMVENIREGRIRGYMALDARGSPLQLA